MESLELEVEEPVAGLAVRLLDEDLAEVVHVLDHVQHLEIYKQQGLCPFQDSAQNASRIAAINPVPRV